jgi:hypothetical protein
MPETFIFSEGHDEYGSDYLSAHPTEQSLVIAMKEYQSRMPDEELISVTELLDAARKLNGERPTDINLKGWGGASIFILKEPN